MRLKWRRRANLDFQRIRRHIARANPLAAMQVSRDIQAAADRLVNFPELGHAGEHIGVREMQVPGRPYLLPYRIQGDVIEILAVFDQRRDPEDLF